MFKKYINSIQNIEEYDHVASTLNEKQKGDLFEELTYYIFKYHYMYQNETKNVWLWKDMPLILKNKLNLPNTDQGIDLIMESTDNKYYGIQCKYRTNKDEVIGWNELGTFVGLTFGIGNELHKGFFVTNTYTLTNNITTTDKIISLYGDFFDELSDDFFSLIKKELKHTKNIIEEKPMIPRNYQKELLTRSIMYFDKNDRGYIELACGMGKTIASYWVNSYMMNKMCIVLVPSLYLLSQFYKEWKKQSTLEKQQINYILVGSDADVNVDNDGRNIQNYNNGLILTTDPFEIQTKMAKIIKDRKIKFTVNKESNYEETHKIVIISTYQSSDKLTKALNKLKIEPDLCIFDEAHKTVGQKDKQFSLLLNDSNLKIKKRLFMTATPKNYEGNDDTVLSMDNTDSYGDEIFSYNTGKGIENDYLCDYQIMTYYMNDDYINGFIKENKYVNVEELELNESHYVACAVMILKAFQANECHHIVTYHNSVNKSKKFKRILESLMNHLKMKDINLCQIDGSSSMNNRGKMLRDFSNSSKCVLTSAKVLNEGINLPVIDGVCFIDPRMSTIDIIQCIGRSIRKHKDKTMAKIFVPIIIENINEVDDSTVYGNMIRILKSLSETDSRICDYFTSKGTGGICNKKLVVHKNLMNVVKVGEVGEDIDIDKWFDNMELCVWKKVDGWNCMYEQLKKWVEDNGRIPIRNGIIKDESYLGEWSKRQRLYKKKNKLSTGRCNKLQLINGWWWVKDDPFNKRYNELKQWIDKNGRLPTLSSDDNIENKLSIMCHNWKYKERIGKLDENKKKCIEKLDDWKWSHKNMIKQNNFDENYDILKQWINENGKLPAASSINLIERKLGSVCSHLRMRKKDNKLTPEQISRLEKLKLWFWDTETVFDEIYDELVQWINENGGKYPSRYLDVPLNAKFHRWVGYQRAKKKLNTLSEYMINKLNEIPNWSWARENPFENNFEKYEQWIKINGRIPKNHALDKTERQIGSWAGTQKKYKKEGKMSEETIKRFEAFGNLWYWL